MIHTGKLRNAIRDEMICRKQSVSVFVGQTDLKIQQAAKQQRMTINSYLIYNRCEEKGIAVQPDTLRNDVQKAPIPSKSAYGPRDDEVKFLILGILNHPLELWSFCRVFAGKGVISIISVSLEHITNKKHHYTQ